MVLNAGSMVGQGQLFSDQQVSVMIRGYKKGSRFVHLGISRPTYCLKSPMIIKFSPYNGGDMFHLLNLLKTLLEDRK